MILINRLFDVALIIFGHMRINSLLTKREVKMDGWISAKFLFAFLLTETSDEVEVNNNAKKEGANIQPS